MGLHTQLKDYATCLPSCDALFYQVRTPRGHDMHMNKEVQMTLNWVNRLIFGRLIMIPFHKLKIKIQHIGFNVGL